MAEANVKKPTPAKPAEKPVQAAEKKVRKYVCFCRCYIGGKYYSENEEIETTEIMPADLFTEVK